MTGNVIGWLWLQVIVVLIPVSLAIGYVIRRRRQNEESLDIIPLEFQPANRVARDRVGSQSERTGGALVGSGHDLNYAHLVAALKNSGTRPLSIDQILVFDQHRLHKYAGSEKAELVLGRGDSKTVEVDIPPLEGVRYVNPPEGGGRIEVITATQTFWSEPFRFSDLA
jgi:hypothetical protein